MFSPRQERNLRLVVDDWIRSYADVGKGREDLQCVHLSVESYLVVIARNENSLHSFLFPLLELFYQEIYLADHKHVTVMEEIAIYLADHKHVTVMEEIAQKYDFTILLIRHGAYPGKHIHRLGHSRCSEM